MGINIKFTAAVIVVAVIGFATSSYFFSGQSISSDWMFDKSKYIQEIDTCLEAHSIGDIALNSFGKHFVANLKEQALKAESEEEVKEIVNRLYTITDCEP